MFGKGRKLREGDLASADLDDSRQDSKVLTSTPANVVKREKGSRKRKRAEVIDLTLSDEDTEPLAVTKQHCKSHRVASKHSVSRPVDDFRAKAVLAPKDTAPFALTGCSCGKPVFSTQDIATCAGLDCHIGTYHKACVGLSNRKTTYGWRCWQCRPRPPASTYVAPRSLQPPLYSSQPPKPSETDAVDRKNLAASRLVKPPPTDLQSSPALQLPLCSTLPPPDATVSSKGVAEPPLHPEQARVVDCIMEGRNVFYTGSAGTGKSTVLKAFVQSLKNVGKHDDIVAPSGIAALNVGGKTIYSYAGWHPTVFQLPLDKLLAKAYQKSVNRRLNNTDVLVIDEISMVERDVLVRLDYLMKEARNGWQPEAGRPMRSRHSAREPFGGVQIVVTGDFCQLPPVKPFQFCVQCGGDELPGHSRQDGQALTCRTCRAVYEDKNKWAFKSAAWAACKFEAFELRVIHRQSDIRFINILQRCRFGQVLRPDEERLLAAGKPDPPGAVRLLPTRREVDLENLKNFEALKSHPRKYDCLDLFMWRNKDEPELQKNATPQFHDRPNGPLLALKDHRFEQDLRLKEGMLVILLVNLDFGSGLVNGSQGKIIGFETHDERKVLAAMMAKLDPTNSKDSPRKSRSGKKDMYGGSELAFILEEQVRTFVERAAIKEWPIVEFQNGVTQPIYAACQLTELGLDKPFSLLGRTQIPLLAAWSITVHKSQGNRILGRIRQAFVAVTSMSHA